MIDERKVRKARKEFLKNPGWSEEYYEAPSPLSRRWKEMEFAYSWAFFNGEGDSDNEDYFNEQSRLENEMDLRDWQYLYRHAGNNGFRSRCREKIDALKKREAEAGDKTTEDEGFAASYQKTAGSTHAKEKTKA